MVGLNAVIQTANPMVQGNIGIGFAIPVKLAKRVAESLIADGTFERPWIGVSLVEQPPMPLPDNRARIGKVVIAEVYENTPADEAGLEARDEIRAVDGQDVKTVRDLQRVILSKPVGARVRIAVVRGEARLEMEMQTEAIPDFDSILR
jgi:S1-C subfamily serine protease